MSSARPEQPTKELMANSDPKPGLSSIVGFEIGSASGPCHALDFGPNVILSLSEKCLKIISHER